MLHQKFPIVNSIILIPNSNLTHLQRQDIRTSMKSHILPVSNPSSSSSFPMIEATAASASASAVMLIRPEDDVTGAVARIFMPPSVEEDKIYESRPFISRTSSYKEAASANPKRTRRRVASDSLLTLSAADRLSSRHDIGGAETNMNNRFGFKFLRYFGLDLYLPKNNEGPKPVVAFITGGAWIIGYKAWGSLLGQQLSERDVIVACIDYRNFPQATIGEMIKDASQGISFVCNNIAEYGGDPNRVYLMGQSAGAHIAACALLEQAIKEASGEKTSWSVSQINAYFGLSGGYNLYNLVDHFHHRGLYRSIFLSIMEGEESLKQYSPEVKVQDPNNRTAVSLLPPVILFHGTADYSIPSDSSRSFAETLRNLGVQAESILYEGKTHTDLFLQDPMRGGRDDMFEDLIATIHAGDSEALARDSSAPPRKRLVPEFMLKLGRSVCPF